MNVSGNAGNGYGRGKGDSRLSLAAATGGSGGGVIFASAGLVEVEMIGRRRLRKMG